MSYERGRRPGDRSHGREAPIRQGGVAPGKRPLTSRLAGPVQARPMAETERERPGPAPAESATPQGKPGQGSPIPSVDELWGPGGSAAGEVRDATPLPCDADLLAALPESSLAAGPQQ